MTPGRVIAIVPAAGRSRRMNGADKLLLPIAGVPLLVRFVRMLRGTSVAGVVVVTRSAVIRELGLEAVAADGGGGAPLFVLAADAPDTEMIQSVRLGLAFIGTGGVGGQGERGGHGRAGGAEDAGAVPAGVLVCPADHARLAAADVEACLAAFRADPGAIVVGTYAGRRGHPLVFPYSDAGFVESAACDAGLRGLPRGHADRVRTVACGEGAVSDVDTRADYERWRSGAE